MWTVCNGNRGSHEQGGSWWTDLIQEKVLAKKEVGNEQIYENVVDVVQIANEKKEVIELQQNEVIQLLQNEVIQQNEAIHLQQKRAPGHRLYSSRQQNYGFFWGGGIVVPVTDNTTC